MKEKEGVYHIKPTDMRILLNMFGGLKMREPERIDRIIDMIRDKWKKAPDMRFGQLLINLGVAFDDFGHWNVEDDKMEKHLKKHKW